MRKWRVGSISTGILFILLGVLLLINQVWGVHLITLIFQWWPVILIGLGVEVLVYHFLQKDVPLKFDFFSMFILFLALIFTLGIYAVQTSGFLPAFQRSISNNQYSINIQKTLPIPDSVKEVVVDIPNGDMEILGSTQKNVSVNGSIRINSVNRGEAEKEISDLFTINTVGQQVVIRLNQENSSKWFGNEGINAKLSISLPEGISLQSKLINGDVRMKGMKKDIVAESINGRIQVEEAVGKLQLSADNGEVKVSARQVAGDWDIRTLNGKIAVTLPENANAKLSAHTEVGSVKGNVNWISKKEENPVGSSKEATLGKGTYQLQLENTNGSIEVNME